jgi:hypothetical protein
MELNMETPIDIAIANTSAAEATYNAAQTAANVAWNAALDALIAAAQTAKIPVPTGI